MPCLLTIKRSVKVNKVLRYEVAVILSQPQLVSVVLSQLIDDVIGRESVQLAKLSAMTVQDWNFIF